MKKKQDVFFDDIMITIAICDYKMFLNTYSDLITKPFARVKVRLYHKQFTTPTLRGVNYLTVFSITKGQTCDPY